MSSAFGPFEIHSCARRALVVALFFAGLPSPLLALPGSEATEYGTEIIEPGATADPQLPAFAVELLDEKPEEAQKAAPPAGAESAEPSPKDDDTPAAVTPQQEAVGPDDLSQEATTLLNAKDVDIAALIKSFSKLTNRNYIVDPAVKGKITILLPSPVTLTEALKILDSVLLLRGFTTVPVGRNTWKVIPAKDARQTTIPLVLDRPDRPSDALVTHILRLRNIPAQELQQTLSQFVSKEGLVNAFPGTNALVIIDSGANIDRLIDLAKMLDVPAIDQDITILPILHAEAKDIAEKINQLLGEGDQKGATSAAPNIPRPVPVAVNPTNAAVPAVASGATTSSNTAGRRALPLKVIPDERTNSVIVVADPTTTVKIRAIVEELDSPVDKSGGKFYVYRLKHADAEELAEILNSLITGSPVTSGDRKDSRGGSSISRSSRDRERPTPRSGFGLSTSSRFSTRREREDRSDSANSSSSPGITRAQTSGGAGGGKVNFEGEVSVAPDASTNSLIINASRTDYLRLKEVIDELDVKRRQVLVEATILEVSLDETEGMGVELQGTAATAEGGIIGQTNFGGLTSVLTNPAALSDLTIAAASSGTLTLPGGLVIPSQAALVSAVSQHRNVNVLSTPTILTTDNEEAEIIVGQNVPFVTGQSRDTTNLGSTFTQVERQDVGITLRITPQISAGSFVNLKTFVEISNVVEGTQADTNGPTTTIRTTETNVEVRDGQMIVTGGLIGDDIEKSDRGVPYFQDIPVLGNLFRRDRNVRRRTNLLIFLTPRVLKDQFDARDRTVDYREKVQHYIDERQIEPTRAEVLYGDSIDRVTESLPPRRIAEPTSPLPPPGARGALERTEERFRMLESTRKPDSARPASASAATGDQPLEVTVKPRLPQPPPRSEESADSTLPIGSGDQPAAPAPATEEPLYVVLRQVEPATESDTVGLVASSTAARKFFAPGRRYRYRENGTVRQFICLGTYPSPDDNPHGRLDWRELSLREIMGLGVSPWERG